MKLKPSIILWTFLWCWFMGITGISIGFGAIFPSLNRISKPFVCPNGLMELEKQVYRPYPGSTITTLTWYCLDNQTGTKRELSLWPMSLTAGTIYGWLFFGAVLIGMWVAAHRPGRGMQRSTSPANGMMNEFGSRVNFADFSQQRDSRPARKAAASRDALARMKELQELRAADMISEAEYQEKRAEILRSL